MENTTIEALEAQLHEAILGSDVATLDTLLADDVIFTTHTGVLLTKEMDLHAHRSGSQRLTRLDSSELQVHDYGDTAVVTVRMDLAGTAGDQAFAGAFRYTRVWINRGGRWQVIAAHVSYLG